MASSGRGTVDAPVWAAAAQRVDSPDSPVRIRITDSTGVTKSLPSPI
jgi:hypothetical protein